MGIEDGTEFETFPTAISTILQILNRENVQTSCANKSFKFLTFP